MWYQRSAVIENAPMNDETLLFHPGAVKFCALNPSAAFLWERLQVPRAIDDLASDLSAAYGVLASAELQYDLRSVVDQLVSFGFLTTSATTPALAPTAAPAAAGRFMVPKVNIMDESEVLAAFQVTSAGVSWWAV